MKIQIITAHCIYIYEYNPTVYNTTVCVDRGGGAVR